MYSHEHFSFVMHECKQKVNLASCLLEEVPGVGVLQLDSLDPAQVVEVPAVLSVASALLRSLCLGSELLCLHTQQTQHQ